MNYLDNENHFYYPVRNNNSLIQIENPETTLAKQESVQYLKLLKEKLKLEHEQQMAKIQTTHQQVVENIRYNALNTYAANHLSSLPPSEAAKIEGYEALPYVERNGLFFKIREPGITLRVNKK